MKKPKSTLYDLLKQDILNLCFHADQNQGVGPDHTWAYS